MDPVVVEEHPKQYIAFKAEQTFWMLFRKQKDLDVL